MTDQTSAPLTEDPPTRTVVEHALIDYGYSPDTAKALLDRLAAEARAE
ncbi:hypothetical protein [Streptomyces sp. NPDC127072]